MLRKILTSILLFALLFGNFFAPPKTVAGEVNTGVAIAQSEGNFDKFKEKLAENFCGEGVRDVASCSGYTLGQTVAGEVLGYGIGKVTGLLGKNADVVDDLSKQTDEAPKLDADGCPIRLGSVLWWEIKVMATTCPTYQGGSKYEKKFSFEAGVKRAEFDKLEKQIREFSIPSNARGNLAIANISIDAIPNTKQLKAFSKNSDLKDISSFVKEVENPVFTPIESAGPNGIKYLREYDTEYKILEEVASQLGSNTKATGVIDLYSKLPVCESCSGVIAQFREKYPNITINVIQSKTK